MRRLPAPSFLSRPLDSWPTFLSLKIPNNISLFQYWWYNTNRYLMRDYLCVGVLPDGEQVAVMDCAHVRPWFYDEKTRKLTYGGRLDNGFK